MNACFKLNLQVVLCAHSVFSRQPLGRTTLFRHKHAECSGEEFTSGTSSSQFTIAEESIDRPVQVLTFAVIHVFSSYPTKYHMNDTFALCCLTTKTNSLNALVRNNPIVNMNNFRWKEENDLFLIHSFVCSFAPHLLKHAVTIQTG